MFYQNEWFIYDLLNIDKLKNIDLFNTLSGLNSIKNKILEYLTPINSNFNSVFLLLCLNFNDIQKQDGLQFQRHRKEVAEVLGRKQNIQDK